MEWAALIAWVVTAAGGFVLLAIWLSRGGMQQGREPGSRIRPPLIPDREHREAEHRDHRQERERDPGQRVAVGRHVDDPDHEACGRQQEVAEYQGRSNP